MPACADFSVIEKLLGYVVFHIGIKSDTPMIEAQISAKRFITKKGNAGPGNDGDIYWIN